MKLVTFTHPTFLKPHVGVVCMDDFILDLTVATVHDPAFASMVDVIRGGETTIGQISRLLEDGQSDAQATASYPLDGVTLLAPIPRPEKNIFCVGRNYVDHVSEGYKARGQEIKLPEFPQFFTKPCTTVIGPGATIPRHSGVTPQLDYEVELAVIIGRTGRDIAPENWRDYVFGYTIVNDITARDVQRRHEQWFKGKGLDGSCPMGPWIVLDSMIADPQALELSLTVNGERRQAANTKQMIFDLPRILAELSAGMTLEPGDIIATGTPSGVGYAMTPPHFLQVGDVVTCQIDGIGTLENRIG